MTRRAQAARAGKTHGEQRRAMHSKLNNLNGSIITRLNGRVGRERDLRQADGSRVGVLAGPQDLEGRNHGEAHVPGPVVGAVGAEAHVDVEEGRGVALEPARLEGEGAARRGPVCAVCCCWVATACVLSAYMFGACDGRGAGVEPASQRREEMAIVTRDHRRSDSHGYIHCMPNGNVSLVMRLSPLHPGYVRTVCAEDSVAALMSASNVEENIVFVCGCVCV